VATVGLVSGPLTVWKNGTRNNEMMSNLSYDQDLGIFKLVDTSGNIWMTFQPAQVTAVSSRVMGLAFKSHSLTIDVKFPSGDEYRYIYRSLKTKQVEDAKKWFDFAANRDAAVNEIVTLMTTREKVPLTEVGSVLAKRGLPSSDNESRKMVEYGIATRKVEGVLDGTEFVSKYALNREQVRYEIVSKFEVGKDGAIVLKCPSCGASLPLQGKESSGVCRYCGTAYNVPRNILKLI
jgi:hypothetical protein